jgi:hypothetical protein
MMMAINVSDPHFPNNSKLRALHLLLVLEGGIISYQTHSLLVVCTSLTRLQVRLLVNIDIDRLNIVRYNGDGHTMSQVHTQLICLGEEIRSIDTNEWIDDADVS